ncbi:MAG: hypothetical protein MRY79_04750, partial [Alphaproteobacteria bacterium]|nr:hypothetical protein [Alphaproteobacteria bacterium]
SQIPESYKKDEDVFVQIESYARDKGFSCSELLKACNDAGFCYEKYFEGKLGPGACPSVEMQEEAAKEALKVFPEKFLNYKK